MHSLKGGVEGDTSYRVPAPFRSSVGCWASEINPSLSLLKEPKMGVGREVERDPGSEGSGRRGSSGPRTIRAYRSEKE